MVLKRRMKQYGMLVNRSELYFEALKKGFRHVVCLDPKQQQISASLIKNIKAHWKTVVIICFNISGDLTSDMIKQELKRAHIPYISWTVSAESRTLKDMVSSFPEKSTVERKLKKTANKEKRSFLAAACLVTVLLIALATTVTGTREKSAVRQQDTALQTAANQIENLPEQEKTQTNQASSAKEKTKTDMMDSAKVNSADTVNGKAGTEKKPDSFSQIKSWPELYDKLRMFSEMRASEYTLYYSKELDLRGNHLKLNEALYASGVASFDWSFTFDTVTISNIRYPDNFRICSSADETLSYIGSCADTGISNFDLYFTSDFGAALFENNKYQLERLLAVSRLLEPSAYSEWQNRYAIRFEGAKYYASTSGKSGIASTLQDLHNLFGGHLDAMDKEFDIMITDELKKQLDAKNPKLRGDSDLLGEIAMNYGVSYSTRGRFLIVSSQFMAGQKILFAYRKNRTDILNNRETATLKAALDLVSRTSGSDLEREKQIHDMLCTLITYSADKDEHNDDDCAIGALLNGLANCDGYSDAFYLCGNLAGLKIRYMHGYSIEQDASDDDGAHMWNLVNVNGTWVITDVTWDDRDADRRILYMTYNIGLKEAEQNYMWEKDAIPVPVLSATSNAFRNAELASIYTEDWNQVYAVLRDAAGNRKSRIILSAPSALNFAANSDRLGKMLYSVGVKSGDFTWKMYMGMAEMTGLEYYDSFAVCDTRDDVVRYIITCKERGQKEVRLFCSTENLFQYFSDHSFKAFGDMLSSMGYYGIRYTYNDSSRMFCFDFP